MRPERQLAIVAHHESGHAVTAILRGHTVSYASIRPDRELGRLGNCQAGGFAATGVQLFEEYAIFTVAGAIAQRLFAPRSPVHEMAVGDQEWLGEYVPILIGEPAARLPFERHVCRIARRLLVDHWWAVHRVAELLLEQGTASGFAIAERMREAAVEWEQLRSYHPDQSPIDVMRERARLARPKPTLRRNHVFESIGRAVVVGVLDIRAAVEADLATRGFHRNQIMAMWPHTEQDHFHGFHRLLPADRRGRRGLASRAG